MLSTSERVHDAALRLFASRGFEGTGIRRIAEEAGITVASLYHYVGTKEDLLERMMQESMTELLGPARDLASATPDPRSRIAALVDLHVRRHATHAPLCRVGDTELRSLSGDRRARIVALRDQYQAIWAQAIADGCACGAFAVPDVKIAALALVQMCTGVAHWYAPGGRLSLDQVSAAFVTMACSLLEGT
jgi:AcrR family transcriptional regulator